MTAARTGGSRFLYAPFDHTETAFGRVDQRLQMIEAESARIGTERAVNEEKAKLLQSRFNQIDTRLDRIDALISRLVWLIVAAILGGFMSVLLEGGRLLP